MSYYQKRNNRKQVADDNKQIVIQNKNLIPPTYRLFTKSFSLNSNIKDPIEFLECTTNQAVQYYLKENPTYNIAVLNFANSHHAGGGYEHGAMAQEEELCRTSPYLYASLRNAQIHDRFYDTWKDKWDSQVLYTPDSLFIRQDSRESNGNYDFLNENDQFKISVITAAAPNLGHITDLKDIPNRNRYINLIHNIYYAPELSNDTKIDILILGALGCGAFAPSDPNLSDYNRFVAKCFRDALNQVGEKYKKICFAIPSGNNNYDVFFDEFSKK